MTEFQRFRKPSGDMDDIIEKNGSSSVEITRAEILKPTEWGWWQIIHCRRKTGEVEPTQKSHLK